VTATPKHYCPSCGAGLVSAPIDASLFCKHCGWKLVSREKWQTLSPFQQGYTFYMQASWPTSQLKGAENPYAEGTARWTAFREGEQRAMLSAQDGEE